MALPAYAEVCSCGFVPNVLGKAGVGVRGSRRSMGAAAPGVPLPNGMCPGDASLGYCHPQQPLEPVPGDVGLQPSGSLRVPGGWVARRGRQEVLSRREGLRREIDLGAAELGARFGSCKGCSIRPWRSPLPKLPRERWDHREEPRGEEERGAQLVPGLPALLCLPCDVHVDQGHVWLCHNRLSRKQGGFSFFPHPLVHGVLIRRIWVMESASLGLSAAPEVCCAD